jgi:hypothetical protein
MLTTQLELLLSASPFEPFRIKMVNGDVFDVFDPQTAALQRRTVFIAAQDQNWVVLPIDKTCSLESLIADYRGQLAAHAEP